MTEKQIKNCEKLELRLKNFGYKISFCSNYTPLTLKRLITHALEAKHSMLTRATKKVGEGKYRPKQKLGGSRSLQDLYLLALNYFPEVTVKDVVLVLREINSDRKLYKRFCPQFGRTMFLTTETAYYPIRDLQTTYFGI